MRTIESKYIQEFRENGAVIIRNILTSQALETLKNGIDYNLENLSVRAIQTEAVNKLINIQYMCLKFVCLKLYV